MMQGVSALTEGIKVRFEALRPVLDEKTRRLWAGAEAKAIGRGGIARVAESTACRVTRCGQVCGRLRAGTSRCRERRGSACAAAGEGASR